jgi:AhpD family alkylhydroperoxidase
MRPEGTNFTAVRSRESEDTVWRLGPAIQYWEENAMTRKEVYKDVEKMFGLVPTMFTYIPDDKLEMEWNLFKRIQFEEGPIPNKYRELIGLGVAAVKGCPYCAFYHTEVAKLNGATDAEIEDAVHYAKSSAGWSTYLHGMQIDLDEWKQQVLQACEFVRSKQPVGA